MLSSKGQKGPDLYREQANIYAKLVRTRRVLPHCKVCPVSSPHQEGLGRSNTWRSAGERTWCRLNHEHPCIKQEGETQCAARAPFFCHKESELRELTASDEPPIIEFRLTRNQRVP